MRAWAKQLVIVATVLIAVPVVLYAASAWRGAPAEQRRALQAMRAPVAAEGENAFAALWLLRYDVPEREQPAVAAQDVARFAAQPVGAASFVSRAAAEYPDLLAGDGPRTCHDACLADVRARPAVFAGWNERHARLIERNAALARYGHYRSGFAARLDAPIPPLQALSVAHAGHAVAFAQGQHDIALKGVCRDAATWRRLMPRSDSLLLGTFAASQVDRSVRLFADMLAELPPRAALPDECTTAFAPPRRADSAMCPMLKGELGFVQGAIAQLDREGGSNPFYDPEMTAARAAWQMSNACTGADASHGATAAVRGFADRARAWWPPLMRLECVSNFTGCVLSETAAPAYQSYIERAREHDARLRAGAALLQWHREPPRGAPVLPAALRDGAVPLRLGPGGRSLQVPLSSPPGERIWEVPLPSSRAAAARSTLALKR